MQCDVLFTHAKEEQVKKFAEADFGWTSKNFHKSFSFLSSFYTLKANIFSCIRREIISLPLAISHRSLVISLWSKLEQ